MSERNSADGQRDWANERAIIEAHAGDRIALLVDSFHRLAGRPLISDQGNLAENLWALPSVVVAHATGHDPVFFYANRAALSLFEASAQDFIRMPSRFSAEPVERSERARFMAKVRQENIIADYRGIRISRTGRRFAIERAIVWNLVDEAGLIHGQAATFAEWTPLPA
ncbi:MAG: MEKHLA domain-containing protein [Caenibius sp.]